MNEHLSPEYEAKIREHVATMSNYSLGNLFARDLLAELDRVRAERDQYANHLDGIHLAQWEDKQETPTEQALRIEETNPAAAFTHDCGIPLTRRLDCGHCPHEICQDCDRCPHTCRCGSEGGDR